MGCARFGHCLVGFAHQLVHVEQCRTLVVLQYLRAQARVASASRIWRWAVSFALRLASFLSHEWSEDRIHSELHVAKVFERAEGILVAD